MDIIGNIQDQDYYRPSADRQSTIQMNNDLPNFEKLSVYMISVKGETLKTAEENDF